MLERGNVKFFNLDKSLLHLEKTNVFSSLLNHLTDREGQDPYDTTYSSTVSIDFYFCKSNTES